MDRGLNKRIWMKLVLFYLLVAQLLFLSACSIKKVPRLKVEHAWISWGGEKVEMRFPGKMELRRLEPYQRKLYLIGGNDAVSVSFGGRQLVCRSQRDKINVVFNASKSFYQSNDKEKEPLDYSVAVSELGRSKNYYLTFRLPETLTNVSPNARGELLEETLKRIKNNDDIVHRFYFDFLVDGVPYTVDIAFRLEVETTLEIGVPATP